MPGYTTKVIILTADIISAFISIVLAVLLTNNFKLSVDPSSLSVALAFLISLRVFTYFLFGTYRIIIRYIGEKDYRHIFYAVSFSSILFSLGLFVYPDLLIVENKVAIVVVDYVLLLFFTTGFRIFLRSIVDQIKQQRNAGLPTAIFGAGELGAMLESVLKHNHDTVPSYKVVAFFDDKPEIHKKMLNGIQIFNPNKSFAKVIKRQSIKVAIIAINNLAEKRRIEFINACLEHQVKVLKIPPVASWIDDKLNMGQIKDIKFEDLLNRPPIQLNKTSIKQSVSGKVVLVTGCAGSIGSEIVRQLLRYSPKKVIGFDQAETPLANLELSLKMYAKNGLLDCVIGDVRDWNKLEYVFNRYRPDFVFHAAAYKHVPVMEDFPEEAIKVNVFGTKNLADLSINYSVEKFVMISTDKVVNPSNVMGASKRIAEIYVQSLNYAHEGVTQFITTRFGNVLGSNGSVIPIFRKQIENRKPVTVTHPEVTRFFMTIPEACQLVLEAGVMGNGGEIFVFDMGEPVKIVELARKMIQMAGLTPNKDVDIIFTGLRPGEKLYEELLDGQEGILKTHHPKIKKAQVRVYDYAKVNSSVEYLISLTNLVENGELIVKCMKEIVPEFNSQNSYFSKLDKAKATNSVNR